MISIAYACNNPSDNITEIRCLGTVRLLQLKTKLVSGREYFTAFVFILPEGRKHGFESSVEMEAAVCAHLIGECAIKRQQELVVGVEFVQHSAEPSHRLTI